MRSQDSFRRKLHRWAFTCAVSMFGLSLSPAHAQDLGSRQATAQALFEQGRSLIAEGKTEEACPKFAESQRLDPGVGTQFNLADCYEKIGRFASAYALYIEVAAATRQSGQGEREAVARQRAAKLKPKLSRLTVTLNEDAKVEGLEVRRDGIPVGAAQWGVPIPVDPGTHEVTATAPGYQSWSASIEVPPGTAERHLAVPALIEVPEESRVEDPVAPGSSFDRSRYRQRRGDFWSSPWNIAGVSFGVVGAAGLGVGGYFGYRAVSYEDESEKLGCDGDACPTRAALDARNDAKDAGDVATLSMIGGGAALLTAGLLIWVIPELTDSSTAVTLTPNVGGSQLNVSGVF